MSYILTMNNFLTDLTLLGLLADIVGAVFVSKSIIFRRNSEIFNMSGAFWGYSSDKTLDAIIAKREGVLGCFLLILGFTGQFFGSFNNSPVIWDWYLIVFSVLGLTLFCLAASFVIRKWSEKTTDELIRAYKEREDK